MKYIFLLILVLSHNVYPQDLSISISEIPPWIHAKENKCDSGIICRLFNIIDQKIDGKINVKVTSLARANQAIFNGEQDIAFSPKLDRIKDKYFFLKEALNYRSGFFTAKKNIEKIMNICTTRKNPHLINGFSYLYVDFFVQCLQMLKKKRVDAILTTDVELDYFEKNLDFSKDKFSFIPKNNHSLWLYLNQKFKADSKIFKKLKSLKF